MDTTFSPPPAPLTTPQRARTARHVVALVVGCLALLPGLALMAGGGVAALAQAVATDDEGYFRITLDPIASDGVAVTADEWWFDDVDDDATWLADWLDVDLRVRVDGARASDDVFVGIARTADLDAYLAGAARSEIVEVADDRSVRYDAVTGEGSVAPPGEQDFWVASSSGTGERELTWQARGGRWSVAVMNADGTPLVDADVEIGIRSDAVTPIAVTLFIVGGIVTAVAVTLIILGVRGRRSPAGTATPSVANPSPGPVDTIAEASADSDTVGMP